MTVIGVEDLECNYRAPPLLVGHRSPLRGRDRGRWVQCRARL